MKHIVYPILSLVLLFTSCKKEKASPYDPNVKGGLSLEFDNVVGSSDLQLTTGSYTNSSNENFTVTRLKYYVSNFKLTNSNGTTYTVPQNDGYFLIDESSTTNPEPELEIPEGEYTNLSFTIGVDSVRSTKDISERTGVLDPTGVGGEMYWSWNSGYIFFKMEGTSAATTSGYQYHIGGFGGYSSATINNLRTVSLDLTARGVPQIKAGKATNIHLMVDILKLFNGTTTVSIAANPAVMFNPYSATIANNFSGMFRHDHTEN